MAAHKKTKKLESSDFTIAKEPFYLPQTNEIELFETSLCEQTARIAQRPHRKRKDTTGRTHAWRLGLSLYTVACHDDLSANDLTGRYIIKGDEVEWIDGPLPDGCTRRRDRLPRRGGGGP